MIADLHIHTSASDGRLSPTEIARQAKQNHLSIIAITDHDTVEGVPAVKHAAGTSLNVIPGIEFNTDVPLHEVHILGYNIDIYNRKLCQQLGLLAGDRLIRARKIIDKLTMLGYPITFERVMQIAGASKSIGRPHIAKALIELGYFSNVGQVFDTLLATNGPAYVPHYKLTPLQAIRLIHAAGGKAVLAHPGLIGSETVIDQILAAEIDGIEVYHPKHSNEQTRVYLAMAQAHNLLVTGGSDFHGIPGRYPQQLGEFSISADLAQKLLAGQA